VGAANQANWLRLIEVIDAHELIGDPRSKENAERMDHLDQLTEVLEPYFRRRTSTDWLSQFEKAGLPAGPIYNMKEVLENEQTRARNMLTEVPHQTLGKTKTLGAPVKFSHTPSEVRRGAPVLGQHSREILAEIGFSAEQIANMERDKVVLQGDW
jgi:crotonobetainyl-CoA:carnitine CoA-transferase CaiB-like acyl-CoA transferase